MAEEKTPDEEILELSIEHLTPNEMNSLSAITDQTIPELHSSHMGSLLAGLVAIVTTRNPNKEEAQLLELRVAKFKENMNIKSIELKNMAETALAGGSDPKGPQDYKKPKKTS